MNGLCDPWMYSWVRCDYICPSIIFYLAHICRTLALPHHNLKQSSSLFKKMFNKQIIVYYQFCFIYLHVNFKNVTWMQIKILYFQFYSHTLAKYYICGVILFVQNEGRRLNTFSWNYHDGYSAQQTNAVLLSNPEGTIGQPVGAHRWYFHTCIKWRLFR